MFYFFHVALLLIITSCSSQKVEYKALENNYTYRQKTEKEYRQKGLIPLEHFLRRPQIQGIKISPNGKYIAYYKPVNDKFNIFVRQLDGKGKERQITQISKKTEPDAGHFLWKERETLIFFKYIKEERVQHIFRLSAPKGKEKNITPKETISFYPEHSLNMISPTDIIISSNERGWKYRDVYRLNTRTGAMQKVLQNSQEKAFTSFIFDNRGQLRGATSRKDLNKNIYYRKGGNFPMEKVLTVTHPDKLDVVGFTPNNRDIYILSNVGRNTVALQIFNPQRKKVVRTLFSHPKRNVTGIAYAPDYNQLLYATYRNSIGVQRKFFNSPTKRLYREAERKIPSGSKFSFVSFDRRRNKYIVLVYNDRTSAYYTYHRREKKLAPLAKKMPWFKEGELSPTSTISYPSRDGWNIEGLVTLPKGKGKKNLPFVVYVDNGMSNYQYWGVSRTANFLANRGYGVLRVNFRGSLNWGKKFFTASFKERGGRMQDDITDGVKYIIKQGLANKNKICIFGAGSRGYAALAGLTFTPDLYACGISLNEMGYLNLFNLMAPELHSSERYDYLGLLYKVIGHPEKDKQLLKKTSPFYHAKNIKRPLLIAHGALNSMVKKPEVDTFVRRLQKNGLNPVYMVKYKEGSRWSSVDRKENLMEFYSVLEEFLAQHLASK